MITNYARLRHNTLRFELPLKWLLVAIGVVALFLRPVPGQEALVGIYGLVVLALTIYFSGRWGANRDITWPYWFSLGIDVLFITGMIALGDGLASPLYLLYPLIALKSLVFAPDIPASVWLPFLFGPLYAFALALAQGSLAFLADPLFLTRYLLLLFLTVGIAIASWTLAGRLREVDRLRKALDARTQDLASQTHTLQRTATDLGDRVLELRSLQEVAKALSATLYMKDTLQTIADRLKQLSDSPYCAVLLLDSDREAFSMITTPAGTPPPTNVPLYLPRNTALEKILRAGRSQMLSLTHNEDGNWLRQQVTRWPVESLEITPMMSRGQPVGALFVGFEAIRPEAALHRSLAESFAYFAATSLENARLYGDVAEKSRELEAVLAGIGDGVLVADTRGGLVLMNPVAAHIFALQAPRVGEPVRELLPVPELVDLLEKTTVSGRVAIRELPIPSAGTSSDGEPRTYQALAAPVYRDTEGDEQIGGVVTVLRDITGQKELERMKSNFLSVVSHELKTPLHSIKGFVDIILMGKTGPVTELQSDFLTTVQEQTGHLQRLIEDLLEFSRLESGQVRLRPVKVYPTDLAVGVLEKLAPLANHKQINLILEAPPSMSEIEADAMRLEQVITNLVENAIKFTPKGGEVRICGWDDRDHIEMAVLDNGIGIPPEERDKIFDRFYQVDSSAQRRYKGTGLGLTICKHIITQHGGHIWVESRAGPGSEFHFSLPKHFPQADQGEVALDFGAFAKR
jgi:signal transduction histidine kinase